MIVVSAATVMSRFAGQLQAAEARFPIPEVPFVDGQTPDGSSLYLHYGSLIVAAKPPGTIVAYVTCRNEASWRFANLCLEDQPDPTRKAVVNFKDRATDIAPQNANIRQMFASGWVFRTLTPEESECFGCVARKGLGWDGPYQIGPPSTNGS